MCSGTGARMATIGTFDGVHCGHQSVLSDMKAICESKGMEPLVVTFDRHPLELIAPERAPRLLMSPQERYDMLREFVPNVVVVKFDESVRRLTAAEFMAMLRVDYGVEALMLGFNHRFGSDGLRNVEQYEVVAAEIGMKIFRASEMKDDNLKISSTAIREYLTRGDVATAARCLTRSYRMVGSVTSGKQLGRRIGFPTANIVPNEPRQLVPKTGVYACIAECSDGMRYRAMVNVGMRPTVDDSGHITIEAHLFDFSGDLYDATLSLDFVDRIRNEKQFASVGELQQQLFADAVAATEILKNSIASC